ncbi:hypothetical protein L4D76_16425 [Photobacterium sagamiensis]|uniref:hypothetical protein n=1 Tax=Photobacterium sagamiensis TaxID=2910241 RepID=UPI003D148868
MMRKVYVVVFVGLIAGLSHAEALLMSYEDYMDRCLNTYGEDLLTKSVCEKQYQAIAKKEQSLMVKTERGVDNQWLSEHSEQQQPNDIE